MNEFFSLDLVKFTLPLLGAVIAWLVNQWQQRARDEYLRKEKLYRDLLNALEGFYTAPPDGPLCQRMHLARWTVEWHKRRSGKSSFGSSDWRGSRRRTA